MMAEALAMACLLCLPMLVGFGNLSRNNEYVALLNRESVCAVFCSEVGLSGAVDSAQFSANGLRSSILPE